MRASHLSHPGDLRNALERSPRSRGVSWLCKFSILLSETQSEELTLQILMRVPSKVRECEMRAQMEHKTWTRSEIEPFVVVEEGHSPREPTPVISASSVLVVAALQVSYVSCNRQFFYKSRENQENAPPCGM